MISLGGAAYEDHSLVERTERFFSPGGALSELPDFEFRPQQVEMAQAVAAALAEDRPLAVEAGTGVGKSLAYLVPALMRALGQRRKAVISTHTINLQEQLIAKDLPLLAKVFPEPFTAILLKGRRNYLCPQRLDRALQTGGDLFSSSDREELEELSSWAEETKDGSLSDLDFQPHPRVWAQVCSEPHVCTVKRCGPGGRCFYQEVRKRVAAADLVVVNHTLFFTLAAGLEEIGDQSEGFLFPGDFAILDEAHTLEAVAARQLGLSVSQSGLRFELQRLYNPRNRKGLFTLLRDADGIRATQSLLDASDEFFEEVESVCDFGSQGREFRVRDPDLVENRLGGLLMKARQHAVAAADRISSEVTKAELQDLARKLGEVRGALATFLDQDAMDHVYWVAAEGADRRTITLNAAPVRVGELLRPLLWERGRACVATSATLSIGDRDLDYFRKRVGGESIPPVQIGSPFDYGRQMKIYLPRTVPAPGEEDYERALEDWIRRLTKETQGGAFVLFTSYRLMQSLALRLEDFFSEQDWEFLVQGRDRSRQQMIRRFRESGRPGILFGTDSFWAGVDVPGEALRNVIITRLPFAVPDHPVTQAQAEAIESEGKSAFMEYSLPEAVLKLRQGVGRLIRSEDDKGIVSILDTRILTKRYGKVFLKALPEAPVEELD